MKITVCLKLLLTISLYIYSYTSSAQSNTLNTVKDLPAVTNRTYFSIDNAAMVTGADTTGGAWDIAFYRTQVWINSGPGSKGTTKAILLKNTLFDKITTAPANGYLEDTPQARVIPAGSGKGWYVYDMTTHTINPAPGRIIIIQTSTGKLAKLEILNYYKNGDGEAGYYTFRYAFIEKAK